jgi:hypothetical protein
MRAAVLLVLLGAPVAWPSSAQAPDDAPQQVTSRFVAAMRAGDWHGMAVLMHPDALRQMRELLAALFEAPNADDVRQQLLGVTTLAEARAMSDTAVFAAVMRVMGERDAGLAAVLRSAQVEILGRVDEGRDTTHVVYRMAMTVDAHHEDGCDDPRPIAQRLARPPQGRPVGPRGRRAGRRAAAMMGAR